MIANGLAQPRLHLAAWCADRRPALTAPKASPAPPSRPLLAAGEADVRSWADTLDADGRMLRRLIVERAWAPRITRALQIGFDGARITIPIRETDGELRGILRYDPFGPRDPKMRAAPGTRLGLIPHPSSEASNHIILVEGPPDMISARSAGLPAIAIPGTNAWHPAWAELLATKMITIVMDCDAPGRRAAHEIAASLDKSAKSAEIVDLWPDRDDGYDLTDRILERRQTRPWTAKTVRTVRALLAAPPSTRHARPQSQPFKRAVQQRGDRDG